MSDEGDGTIRAIEEELRGATDEIEEIAERILADDPEARPVMAAIVEGILSATSETIAGIRSEVALSCHVRLVALAAKLRGRQPS